MKRPARRKKYPKPHPVDIQAGKWIKQFRNLRGLSPSDLAKQLGGKFQQVQKYESVSNRISTSKLKVAAETLDVSIMDLFRDD